MEGKFSDGKEGKEEGTHEEARSGSPEEGHELLNKVHDLGGEDVVLRVESRHRELDDVAGAVRHGRVGGAVLEEADRDHHGHSSEDGGESDPAEEDKDDTSNRDVLARRLGNKAVDEGSRGDSGEGHTGRHVVAEGKVSVAKGDGWRGGAY